MSYNSTYNLQGKPMAITYGQLMETDGHGLFYDGHGNQVFLTASVGISSSYAITSSYSLNNNGGTNLTTASTYPITSSWSNNSVSSSWTNNSYHSLFSDTASFSITNYITQSISYSLSSSWTSQSFSSSYSPIQLPDITDITSSYTLVISNGENRADLSRSLNLKYRTVDIHTTDYPFGAGHGSAAILDIDSGNYGHLYLQGSGSNGLQTVSITANDGGGYFTGNVTAPQFIGTSSYSNNSSTSSISTSSSFAQNAYAVAPVFYDSDNGNYYGLSIKGNTGSEVIQIDAVTYNSQSGIFSNVSASYSITSSYSLNSGNQISCSWSSQSLSSSFSSISQTANSLSQSNLIGTSSIYSETYILTGSYKSNITGSYILTNNDNGKFLIVNFSTNSYIQVPSTLNQGFVCSFFQTGSGQLIITGSGVNIRNRAGLSASYAQYSIISLLKLDSGNYVLQGDVG